MAVLTYHHSLDPSSNSKSTPTTTITTIAAAPSDIPTTPLLPSTGSQRHHHHHHSPRYPRFYTALTELAALFLFALVPWFFLVAVGPPYHSVGTLGVGLVYALSVGGVAWRHRRDIRRTWWVLLAATGTAVGAAIERGDVTSMVVAVTPGSILGATAVAVGWRVFDGREVGDDDKEGVGMTEEDYKGFGEYDVA